MYFMFFCDIGNGERAPLLLQQMMEEEWGRREETRDRMNHKGHEEQRTEVPRCNDVAGDVQWWTCSSEKQGARDPCPAKDDGERGAKWKEEK